MSINGFSMHKTFTTISCLILGIICGLVLPPVKAEAIDRPTTDPYEIRPKRDGRLNYQITPIPESVKIEKDVMIAMPDGVKLAANIYRPDKPGKFPVVLSMTPYCKDQAPPAYKPDGSPLPGSYFPFVFRVHSHGADLGHMKVSMLTAWEAPDPAFWVQNDYAVMIVDQRGGFKSEGERPMPPQMGEDLFNLIEWAGAREWSNGNVGMNGVSALAMNQYQAASRQPQSSHLKAIIPWEGMSDMYRDMVFWGGIPETNFSRSLGPFKAQLQKMPQEKAAQVWAKAMDPVANQGMLKANSKLELITTPALICATWSDKGLHTNGTFEVYRRIASKDKWLYIHGGKKWERFYSEDGLNYQKKFFDHYLKNQDNGWKDTAKVRLEIRETRDEYEVRPEEEFPLARTQYRKLYLNAKDASLENEKPEEARISYNSTQGGDASFAITFEQDTEITGYIKAKLWVSAPEANDMDLFVIVKKFAGPFDPESDLGKTIEAVVGAGSIARGNEIMFRGMNGHAYDMAARGQLRVSQRELDEKLSTDYLPVLKCQGEKKLQPGEIVPVEVAILPSSTFFRKGETLRLYVQGYCPVQNPLLYYDWLINKGDHVIHTGGKYDSYLQVPVIPAKDM